MNPEDWKTLKMLPPGPNVDAFKQHLNLDGSYSREGRALLKYVAALMQEQVRRQAEYAQKWGDREKP